MRLGQLVMSADIMAISDLTFVEKGVLAAMRQCELAGEPFNQTHFSQESGIPLRTISQAARVLRVGNHCAIYAQQASAALRQICVAPQKEKEGVSPCSLPTPIPLIPLPQEKEKPSVRPAATGTSKAKPEPKKPMWDRSADSLWKPMFDALADTCQLRPLLKRPKGSPAGLVAQTADLLRLDGRTPEQVTNFPRWWKSRRESFKQPVPKLLQLRDLIHLSTSGENTEPQTQYGTASDFAKGSTQTGQTDTDAAQRQRLLQQRAAMRGCTVAEIVAEDAAAEEAADAEAFL